MTISHPLRRSPSASGGLSAPPRDWQSAYLDATRDALLALDVETGMVVGFNPAFHDLLGYAPDMLVGLHFSSLLPPLTANPKTPVGRRFPLTGEVAEAQLFQHSEGYEIPCDVLVTAVRSTATELAVLHLRDVREREAARQAHLATSEAEIALAKSDDVARAVEHYMSHVSHELRTPLAVILSSSSMLERYYARLNEVKRDEHFSRIQTQVKYLTMFLDDLRLLSRLDAGRIHVRREPSDTATLAQEIINEFGGHPRLPRFDLQTDGVLDALNIDGTLWRRALFSLIQNAVKYGRLGGNVRVRIGLKGDMLETTISDDGPGLPATYVPVAFTEFKRGENIGDELGGGLGLAIASRCAALHGGSLTFETAEGIGTTFTLLVPLA